MKLATALIAGCGLVWAAGACAQGKPVKLSVREQQRLETLVCQTQANSSAQRIKAFQFEASPGSDEDNKMALAARTSAKVECATHDQFNGQPMRYIDDCDLVDGEWDCSPHQLEILTQIHGRTVRMRPWGLTPAEAYTALKQVSGFGMFQGQPVDKAIGNSCDISKTRDPEIIELSCEAAMAISFWCPQAESTGCPRLLFMNYHQPAFRRR